MYLTENPSWIEQYNYAYARAKDIPSEVFNTLNQKLDHLQRNEPLVSIIISAWNEEVSLLRCIGSLANQKTQIPIEIIVVNNNSQDDTQFTIDQLHVTGFFQEIQGCGPARQLGQENAKGTYILLADADCLYPEYWVEDMMKILTQKEVVCVYGRYSFISEEGFPRWKLYFFEKMKDTIAEFRHIRKPYLNCYGLSMGYVKEFGLKVGFVMTKFWGDDGKLALGLMKYGKIKQMKSARSRIWTGVRSLQRDGNLGEALSKRLKKEYNRFLGNFFGKLPQD